MKVKKFIEESRTRSEIIHDNFFNFLKEKNISYSQYAKDTNIDKSTPSKWKSGEINMGIDHVYAAAEFFDVTVNDLYYSAEEKKNLAPGFSQSPYDPITAQHPIKTRLLSFSFNHPLRLMILTLVICLVIGIAPILLVLNVSEFWLFLSIVLVFFSMYFLHEWIKTEDTYIINYLDDIYYHSNDVENKKFWFLNVMATVQIASCIVIFILFGTKFISISIGKDAFVIFLIIAIIQATVSLFGFSVNTRKYKQKIYDTEIGGYKTSYFIFSFSITMFISSMTLQFISFFDFYPFLIFSVIVLISSSINFLYTSKNYSKYKLVYEEDGKEPRELFPKK